MTKTKVAMVLDDAQWIDATSLEIIKELVQCCPKLFLFVSSRPVENGINPSWGKLRDVEVLIKVQLQGVSKADLNQFMVAKFKEQGVTSVEPELIDTGIPLFFDVITQELLNNFGVLVATNASGVLYAIKSQQSASALNFVDVSQAFHMQYEKLDNDFRDILKVATFFGQPDATNPNLYGFRHIAILHCIYNGLAPRDREQGHERLGAYYAKEVNENAAATALPVACYHYLRTDRIYESVAYLEQLAFYNDVRDLHEEACAYFEQLLTLIRDNSESILTRSDLTPEQRVSLLTQSRRLIWSSTLAFHLAHQAILEPALRTAREVLVEMGHPLPSTKKEITKATGKAVMSQFLMMYRSDRGRKPLKIKGETVEQRRILSYAYGAIIVAAVYDIGFDQDLMGLVTFECFNVTLKQSLELPSSYILVSAIMAQAMYWFAPWMSDIFLKTYVARADSIGDMIDSRADLVALLFVVKGQYALALSYFEKFDRYVNKYGMRSQIDNVVAYKVSLQLLTGDFDTNLPHLQKWLENPPKDQMWSVYCPIGFGRHHLARNERAKAFVYISMFPTYAETSKTMAFVLNAGNEAWYYALTGEAERSISSLNGIATELVNFDQNLVAIFESLFVAAFVSCILAMPGSMGQRLDTTARGKLSESLSKLIPIQKRLGVKRRVRSTWWAKILCEAVAEYLRGVGQGKAFRALKRALESKKHATELQEGLLIKAVVLGTLGKLAKAKEGAAYLASARAAFERMGAESFLLWLN
ncbi:hypothetical protein HK101_002583 [Irineochytrium annulatum]|nr:hypothetical protein HK101_002583 [Irineochytrium annulatum]